MKCASILAIRMADVAPLLLAVLVGTALGVIFFTGLWWTLARGISSQRAALWFISSLLLRTGFMLAGFYLVARGHWERLLACLVGFVIARTFAMRFIGTFTGSAHSVRRVRHAS